MIAELDEKDKSIAIVFGTIETMLTKKKFKDFFKMNVAAQKKIKPCISARLLDKLFCTGFTSAIRLSLP